MVDLSDRVLPSWSIPADITVATKPPRWSHATAASLTPTLVSQVQGCEKGECRFETDQLQLQPHHWQSMGQFGKPVTHCHFALRHRHPLQFTRAPRAGPLAELST